MRKLVAIECLGTQSFVWGEGESQRHHFARESQVPTGERWPKKLFTLRNILLRRCVFEFFRMEWLGEFYTRYPHIKTDFLLDDAPTDLIAERIDLALRVGVETGSSFKVRRLAPMAMILTASGAYLQRRPAPRTLRELADHDCLTISKRQGRDMWRLQGPRGSQEVSINSRFAVNDMRVLAQACVAGLGIALLPQLIAEPIIAQGQLVRVLPTYRRASSDLALQLVYTSRPPVPPAVAVFADFLFEKLSDAMT